MKWQRVDEKPKARDREDRVKTDLVMERAIRHRESNHALSVVKRIIGNICGEAV